MDERALSAAFGTVVRRLRTERNFSQERFAAAIQMDRAYMGKVERGAGSPTLTTVAKIAGGLGVSMSDLMEMVEAQLRA